MKKKERISLVVHGGAGSHAADSAQLKIIKEAVENGFSILQQGGKSVDAVVASIKILEDSGRFNAGKGSYLQLDGRCRLDASLMEGKTLNGGAVSGIQNVRNPILIAKLIMEKTPHCLMNGEGAFRLAQRYGLAKRFAPTSNALKKFKEIRSKNSKALQIYQSVYGHETVGAVALDRSGHVASGASTGGVLTMLPGRVGDSPLIGAGIYAEDDGGAVSMTGQGEGIIRLSMAKEIIFYLQTGQSPTVAAKKALKRLTRKIQGQAGAIVLNPKGEFGLFHNTPFLSGGFRTFEKPSVVGKRFQKIN